jgi:S1 RNA binding domain protein
MDKELEYNIGDTLFGEIVGLKPYGAFVKLPNEEIGMVHISEVAEEYVKEIDKYLELGQQVAVKVIGTHDDGKYNLSLKDLSKQDEESAQFTHEVEEARQVLEESKDSLQETTWNRPKVEPKEEPVDEHQDFHDWVEDASKIAQQITQRSDARQRTINSIDL